jgi:hypothetical protein
LPQTAQRESRRILDPLARSSEILFGVIMALTFTTTIDAARAGRAEVGTLVFAALGCNLAWGLVDAMMYLVDVLVVRGRDLVTLRAVRTASSPDAARAIVADALPPIVVRLLTGDDLARVQRGLAALTDVPARPWLEKHDWLGAAGVFLLVFLSTLPLVVPFFLIADVRVALRVSNAIAIMMLFATGYLLGRYGGYRPWLTAVTMVVLGCGLVALTIALGG